jgi:hypothetical protein
MGFVGRRVMEAMREAPFAQRTIPGSATKVKSGQSGIRTHDPFLVREVLYTLSYPTAP